MRYSGLKIARLLCGFVFCSGISSSEVSGQQVEQIPESVSLIQLIASPREWDGKLVRVIGFCRLEFEGHALYLHKQDFDQAIPNNGVWLGAPWPVPDSLVYLSDEYVLVEAFFNAKDKGHFGMFSGSLERLQRIEVWEGRKRTERLTRLKWYKIPR